MIVVQEVTKWDMDYQPNNIYLVDSDRAYAFIPRSTGIPVYFTTPMKLDMRGRRFTELDSNPFNSASTKSAASETIKVTGSKGMTYFVNPEKGNCTCPGWKFRGTCKHLEEVMKSK